MSATITSTSDRVTISGNYKAFTSASGSTTTVIQYSSGDAPASGDAGRFLLWKNTSNTGNWEVRFIESATSSTVTVTDGGFSSAPPSNADFAISTSLADIDAALADTIVRSIGKSYQIIDRDFSLTSNAFVADVDASLSSKSTQTGTGFIPTYPVANNCVLQFGRLIGGEANDSVETVGGCQLLFVVSNTTLMFTDQDGSNSSGCVVNFYGCLIESSEDNANALGFIRAPGPMRMIGCIVDGPMGGRLYSNKSELVDTRFSGNTNGGVAWSLGASFIRPIENAFFYQNQAAVKSFQGFQGTFSNTRFADSNTYIIEAQAQAALLFKFIDCTTFDVSKIKNNTGNYEQFKSINYTVTDPNGTGLTGVKVAVYDNNGTIQSAIRTSSSGAVSAINAKFFRKSHNVSTPLNYAPFDIRIRKYGYQYQDFQSAVSEPVKQEYRLPTNIVTVLSESSAAALTSISIDFSLKTVTVQQPRTISEIYDYCQSQLAIDANMDELEFLKSSDGNVFTFNDDWSLVLDATGAITSASGKTVVFGGTGTLQMLDDRNSIDNLSVVGDIDLDALITPIDNVTADAINFNVAGTYTLNGCTIGEVTNSSGGSVVLNLADGSTVTTNTGPNITLVQPVFDIDFNTLVSGSQVVVFETGTQTEIFRTNSSSTTETVTLSGSQTVDYTVQKAGYVPIRVTEYSVAGEQSINIEQESDPNYAPSTGLTYPTDGYSAGVYTITGTSSLSNFYNFLVETWIAESSLANIPFPLEISITGSIGSYNFGTDRLRVNGGTFSIDPNKEVLISEANAVNNTSTPPVVIINGGTFNLGLFQSINGVDVYSKGTAMQFLGSATNFFGYYMLYVDGSSTVTWNGGSIRSFGTMRFDDGCTLTINNGTFFNLGSDTPQIRLTPNSAVGGSNMNINQVTLDGVSNAARFFTTYGFGKAVFQLLRGQLQSWNGNYPAQFYINFDNQNNVDAFDLNFSNSQPNRGGNITITNPAKQLRYTGTNNRYGYVRIIRDVSLSPVDLDGNGVEYSYYGQDFDSGNRLVGSNDGGTDGDGLTVDQDDTDTKTYSAQNQNGDANFGILVEVAARVGTLTTNVDERTDQEKIPIKFIGYTENVTTWDTDLYGNQTLTEDVVMTPDLNITELNRATTDAYSTINDSLELYDRAKSYLVTNYAFEDGPILGRSGSQIQLKDQELVIDAAAASAFDYSDPVVTIKSSNFTGGATNIIGVVRSNLGEVTVENGALLSGGVFNCNINYNTGAGTTMTNVTCDAIVDFSVAGTYTLDGCTLSEVTNSSGGNVVLILSNGSTVTTNTGPNITIQTLANVVVNGVTEGTSIKVTSLETVGTLTSGQVIAEGLADANGSFSFTINYETAFGSGLNVSVRCRNQGFPNVAASATSGGTVFADETLANNSSTEGDITLLPAGSPSQNDAYYWGHSEKFNKMKIEISQAGGISVADLEWEFWNGSSWSALPNLDDGTDNYKALGVNVVSWDSPAGWSKNSVNSSDPYYFIRARQKTNVSIPGSQPLGRKVKLDVDRYIPFSQENSITSAGLTVSTVWIKDRIARF